MPSSSQLLCRSAQQHCQPSGRVHRARNSSAPATVGVHPLRCRSVSSCREPAASQQPFTSCESQQHHTPPQVQQQEVSRRHALAGVVAALSLVHTVAAPAHAATAAAASSSSSSSSDLVEGSQHLAEIGSRWLQSFLDGELDGDGQDSSASSSSNRHFGITVPGLSSFSFVHGALVGGAVILLLAADKLTPAKQQQQHQQQPGQGGAPGSAAGGSPPGGPLKPEVEAALMRLLASPQVKEEFHSPAVHAALQEVRVSGPSALQKYRGDAAVMAALSRLLEIEDILERL